LLQLRRRQRTATQFRKKPAPRPTLPAPHETHRSDFGDVKRIASQTIRSVTAETQPVGHAAAELLQKILRQADRFTVEPDQRLLPGREDRLPLFADAAPRLQAPRFRQDLVFTSSVRVMLPLTGSPDPETPRASQIRMQRPQALARRRQVLGDGGVKGRQLPAA